MSRFRNFCFTLNNYNDEEYDRIVAMSCRYMVIGKEIGESGTPHLQGYICYESARSEQAVRKDFSRAHIEVARGNHVQASDYCKKDDKEFFEKGTLPSDPKDKGESEQARWADAISAVEDNDLDRVPADILGRHLKSLEYAVARKRASKRKLVTIDGDLEHEWIYGPTATGKSYRARQENEGAYVKISAAKWWDDYDYEESVIIEEVGLKAAEHAEEYKKILDRYPFRAEVKGGSMLIRPKKVIITSNYHPSQIWTEPEAIGPILRRVKLVHLVLPFKPIVLAGDPPPLKEG